MNILYEVGWGLVYLFIYLFIFCDLLMTIKLEMLWMSQFVDGM